MFDWCQVLCFRYAIIVNFSSGYGLGDGDNEIGGMLHFSLRRSKSTLLNLIPFLKLIWFKCPHKYYSARNNLTCLTRMPPTRYSWAIGAPTTNIGRKMFVGHLF